MTLLLHSNKHQRTERMEKERKGVKSLLNSRRLLMTVKTLTAKKNQITVTLFTRVAPRAIKYFRYMNFRFPNCPFNKNCHYSYPTCSFSNVHHWIINHNQYYSVTAISQLDIKYFKAELSAQTEIAKHTVAQKVHAVQCTYQLIVHLRYVCRWWIEYDGIIEAVSVHEWFLDNGTFYSFCVRFGTIATTVVYLQTVKHMSVSHRQVTLQTLAMCFTMTQKKNYLPKSNYIVSVKQFPYVQWQVAIQAKVHQSWLSIALCVKSQWSALVWVQKHSTLLSNNYAIHVVHYCITYTIMHIIFMII